MTGSGGKRFPSFSSLKGDLSLKLVGEPASDVGRHNGKNSRDGFYPPGKTPWVLLPELEVLNREMHAGKRFTHRGTGRSRDFPAVFSRQAVRENSGLSVIVIEKVAVLRPERARDRAAFFTKVLHQREIEGKSLIRELLKNRQHPAAGVCIHEVIRVFDAGRNRCDRAEGSGRPARNKVFRGNFRNGSKYSHDVCP